MTKKLPEQINTLEKIIDNSINGSTVLDIIGLVFHGVHRLSKIEDGWKNIFSEFIQDSEKQKKNGWPQLVIIKNDFSKRIDVIPEKSFISSKNLLILLQRILYIEKYKENYVFSTYEYHAILAHKINSEKNIDIGKLSSEDLFDLLQKCMQYYIKIYNDDDKFENILAKNILKQLE